MNIIQSILKFAENNNGTITVADARKMGILHGNLGYLVKKGKL
ncbi:MAG: type IV toxin-antitoxin system AbiEi family antitoxin domain-containing protein [Oscillospiraceae bacterium]|nr:type IV toxin-antitoxin system AbiEi family antitoxin domain-containing protein [Oscillospiraceae bacterium]